MLAPNVPRVPPARTLRYFAWSFAFILAVVSLLLPHAQALGLAAALVFALGTVLPHTFRAPYFVLHRLLHAVLPAALAASLPALGGDRKAARKIRKRGRPSRKYKPSTTSGESTSNQHDETCEGSGSPEA
jgi:hypothetical protein